MASRNIPSKSPNKIDFQKKTELHQHFDVILETPTLSRAVQETIRKIISLVKSGDTATQVNFARELFFLLDLWTKGESR